MKVSFSVDGNVPFHSMKLNSSGSFCTSIANDKYNNKYNDKYNTYNNFQILLHLLYSMSLSSEIFSNSIVPLLYLDSFCV